MTAWSQLVRMVDQVPGGAWGVGVSGGADSVALFRALATRADVELVVLHFDHQLRGDESTEDARFVETLARLTRSRVRRENMDDVDRHALVAGRAVPAHGPAAKPQAGRETIDALACDPASARPDPASARIDPALAQRVRTFDHSARARERPLNPQARYRAARYDFFARAVREENLRGVLLAHHAGDQAETVLLRLLRGAGPLGLAGMKPDTTFRGLRVVRPLLDLPAHVVRAALGEIGQPWREDSSNATTKYRRNALRRWLAGKPAVAAALIDVGRRSAAARAQVEAAAPCWNGSFDAAELLALPRVVARGAAVRWLVARGGAAADVSDRHADELINLASRRAGRRHFPGGVLVSVRRGIISAGRATTSLSPERNG